MIVKYSVIIPTCNRSKILKKCLEHIANLSCLSFNEMEVLVIDNNSNDDTERTCFFLKDRIANLEYHFVRNPGLHSCRHFGYEQARGDILCFLDDDSFVSKGWLKGIEQAFQDPGVVLVGGPCLPEYEINPPHWLSKMWSITEEGITLGFLSLINVGREQKRISPYYIYGCNFSIRKDVLADVGGFHPDSMPKELIRFRGDGETFVSRRLIELGYDALYSPDVKIHHFVPASRMTTDYFFHRAYIQGISSSFTQIRKKQGLIIENSRSGDEGFKRGEKTTSYNNIIEICRFFKRGGSAIKNRAVRYMKERLPTEYDRIRSGMRKSSEAGFQYHQAEIKKDPKLLDWVLRENYLGDNGKLPE